VSRALRPSDPRVVSHRATRQRLLTEAWAIARQEGQGALSLGELARRVGLRQPSLYTYFDSKLGLYDAMFAQGNEELWNEVATSDYPSEAAAALIEMSRRIVAFCSADATRYQLLFQRPIPGFEPSPDSYRLALRFYEWAGQTILVPAGIDTPEKRDIYTALVAGIADQQVANDPGGDRWLKYVDAIVGMFVSWLDERDGG
jgi:AcrR family transcriptional regulator